MTDPTPIDRAEALEAIRGYFNLLHFKAGVAAYFRSDAMRERGWIAVAVSEEMHRDEAATVAVACRTFGYEKGNVYGLDGLAGTNLRIALDADGIGALEGILFSPSYLIVEEKDRFMIATDSDFYWMVAGPEEFVAASLGRPINEVMAEFEDDARRCGLHGGAGPRETLLAIHEEATASVRAAENHRAP